MISKYTKHYLVILVAIVAVSLILIIGYTPKIGLEFTGGALIETRYENDVDTQMVKTTLDTLSFKESLGSYAVRETTLSGGSRGVMVRTRDLSEEERVAVTDALTSLDASSTITRYTAVGSMIGKELSDKALWAIVAIVLSIVGYVWYAFRAVRGPVRGSLFGIITVIVLLHDLLVPTAVLAVMSIVVASEIDILFIIALLAILGYSVNDTVVIFDRVREELKRNEEMKLHHSFKHIIDNATRLSLGRSLNTSLTTVFALMALYFFGSPVTTTFSLILIAGVLAGTYSSLFIANPLLLALADKFQRKEQVTT